MRLHLRKLLDGFVAFTHDTQELLLQGIEGIGADSKTRCKTNVLVQTVQNGFITFAVIAQRKDLQEKICNGVKEKITFYEGAGKETHR